MSLQKALGRWIVATVVLLLPTFMLAEPTDAAKSTAQTLFVDLQPLVFQVRVIDIGSGDKYSLGSGFQISPQGHVATNFHVISAFAHEPDKYRLELVTSTGAIESALLRNIDVVHDLAILKADGLTPQFLSLASKPLEKGRRIYSVGNPFDLGMTIIEGTYNGLVKRSRYQKILFSGSLNSGMSGGPTVSATGEVVGINVSKAGEQISFLVPASHLQILMGLLPATEKAINFKHEILKALYKDQDDFFTALLAKPFAIKSLGELSIPGDIDESLRCWGHSDDTEDALYDATHQHCRSDDDIYISDNLVVGDFTYDAEWISSTGLNPLQFYTFFFVRFTHSELIGVALEKDITQYKCNTDFVAIGNHTWKASVCFRAYKEFAELYDALFLMALVESKDKGAIVKSGVSAISKENALALFKAIMESVQWNR